MVVGGLLLAAVVLVAQLTVLNGDDQDAATRAAVITAADEGVSSVLRLSSGEPLPSGVVTDELRQSLSAGSASFMTAMGESGLSLSGSPVETAIIDLDTRSAEVLVATTGEVRDENGRAVSAHQMTFATHLVYVDGRWQIDRLDVL